MRWSLNPPTRLHHFLMKKIQVHSLKKKTLRMFWGNDLHIL